MTLNVTGGFIVAPLAGEDYKASAKVLKTWTAAEQVGGLAWSWHWRVHAPACCAPCLGHPARQALPGQLRAGVLLSGTGAVLQQRRQPCAAVVPTRPGPCLPWCSHWLLPPALQVKRETARTRNDLESYIISMREKMESDELIANVGVQLGAPGRVQLACLHTDACCFHRHHSIMWLPSACHEHALRASQPHTGPPPPCR